MTRMARRGVQILIAVLCLGGTAAPRDVPYLGGRVNDTAEMLTLETRGLLEGELRAYEDSTSTQIVILTVASLEGEVLEEYAYRVADTWRLGRRGKDNGVLLLVARDERKVRIEVGTGLEGVLTDAMAGIIIRRVIVPHFKRGDFDRGVLEGARAIMQAGSGAFTAEEAEDSSATPWPVLLFGMGIFLLTVGITTARAAVVPGFGSWFLYLFLIPFWFAFPTAFFGPEPGAVILAAYLIGVPILKILLRSTPAGRMWQKELASRPFFTGGGGGGGSRSSGGGGFSGGGGGFSGGGASGSW